MNTVVSTYAYLTNTIRVVEIDANPWFVGPDVCRALGLPTEKGVSKYLGGLADDEFRTVIPGIIGGKGMHSVTIISESGHYELITRAHPNRPEVAAFQNWVTREVLPAIRKDGSYMMGEEKVRTGEMSEDQLFAVA